MLRERFAHININKCNQENSCFFLQAVRGYYKQEYKVRCK